MGLIRIAAFVITVDDADRGVAGVGDVQAVDDIVIDPVRGELVAGLALFCKAALWQPGDRFGLARKTDGLIDGADVEDV